MRLTDSPHSYRYHPQQIYSNPERAILQVRSCIKTSLYYCTSGSTAVKKEMPQQPLAYTRILSDKVSSAKQKTRTHTTAYIRIIATVYNM
jgi:hypothetical protein